MRSMLRKYADGYVKWSGKEFIRDRNGSNADVRVRLVALRTIQAVARAGAYATHGNVFHCLSKVADGLESGDLLVDDVSNAKYLLYSGEQHHVGDVPSHRVLYAVRINVEGLRFRRYELSSGTYGGHSRDEVTAVENVLAHFYQSNETPRKDARGRTMTCDAVLVVRKSESVALQDLVATGGQDYEVAGFDEVAMPGVIVLRLMQRK